MSDRKQAVEAYFEGFRRSDTVVAIGTGQGTHASGERFAFAYCDVFTFTGDLISRVESYVVPLG